MLSNIFICELIEYLRNYTRVWDDDQFQWWLQKCDGRMTSDESAHHAVAAVPSIAFVHLFVHLPVLIYLFVVVFFTMDAITSIIMCGWLDEFDCLHAILMDSNEYEYGSAFALSL